MSDIEAALVWAQDFIRRMAPYKAGCFMVDNDSTKVYYHSREPVSFTARHFVLPESGDPWIWPDVPSVGEAVTRCVDLLNECRQHDKVYVRRWFEPVVEQMMSGIVRVKIEARLGVVDAPPA